jgi:FkbM family methyltransferase
MIHFLKNSLGKNRALLNLARSIYYYWRPREIAIASILEWYNNSKKEITFVQVGSNDGKTGDPIYNFITRGNAIWKGLLIEPIPYLYEKLKTNYKDFSNRLKFENMAIDVTAGTKTLYYIRETSSASVTPWYEQIASFNKTIIESQRAHITDFEKKFSQMEVRTETLSALLAQHNLQPVDFFHIDTEGFDYEIIKMISIKDAKPDIILFEHKHLSLRDFKDCCGYLRKKRFKLYSHQGDTLAIQAELHPPPEFLRRPV